MTKSLFSGPVKDILHPKDVGNCLLCYILTTSDSVPVPWTGPELLLLQAAAPAPGCLTIEIQSEFLAILP